MVMGSFSRESRCTVSALRSRNTGKITRRFLIIRAGWMSCLLAAYATAAIAQTTVRVARDRSTIWKPGFQVTAAVVRAGAVLTVVGRRGDWYEVVVPGSDSAGSVTTGFIFRSNIEVISGPLPSPAPPRQATAAPPPSERPRAVGVMGFGQFGYTRFAARESFDAVLGQSGGTFYGGGAEVRLRGGMFLNLSIEHFAKTGQRVFVFDRQVFRLGIPDAIALTPVVLTTGWRFVNDRATPYGGVGIGRILYKETSSFAEAGENVDARFTSYHVLGGIEFREGWVATAFEVQYSRVPNAIGLGGASAAFQESNLGGLAGRVKILVGR